MKGKNGQAMRRTFATGAAILALLAAPVAAGTGAGDTAGHLATVLLRSNLPNLNSPAAPKPLSAAAALTFSNSPLLQSSSREAVKTPEPAPEPPRDGKADDENAEGTVLDSSESDSTAPAPAPSPANFPDNGITPRTVHPTNPAGYLVWNDVYISNSTKYAVDLNALMKEKPAAVLTDELPQVLILHTHGTEAYTMPKGQEYETDIPARSHDTAYNVVRVGDEIASVFEEAGISVLHDRTLHDAESYNGSYAHAEAAIERYLKNYPSIHFVLDVHRDAIEDKTGKAYKVISPIDGKNAAQISLVVGSDGSGLPHDHWRENLKLAARIQQQVLDRYPTLMRPMYLRNSRYNEHATTGSLLVEVGAAGNSLEEALYAARLFAGEMAKVLTSLRPS